MRAITSRGAISVAKTRMLQPARIPWGPKKTERNLALLAALVSNIDKPSSSGASSGQLAGENNTHNELASMSRVVRSLSVVFRRLHKLALFPRQNRGFD